MTIISKQISLGSDDCSESGGTVALIHQLLYVGEYLPDVYDLGLRWQSIDIPRASEIISAKLSVYLGWDVGTLVADLHGIAEDDTATWSTDDRPSQRQKTPTIIAANTADWNNWGVGNWIDIDTTNIIQEIINQDGWVANNALAIVIEDAGSTPDNIIGIRAFEYPGNQHGAKLEIVYEPIPATIPACRILITDLDGGGHFTMDDVQELEISTELSNAADSFSFSLLNANDVYSYIEKGGGITIRTGIGIFTTKIVGYITDVEKTLVGGTLPVISVSGESGEIRLNNVFFSGRFYGYEVSALTKAILDTLDYTTGTTFRALADVDASNAYIEATAYSVDEATYTWKSLGAAIKELADMVGFAWYRDTDKKLHFFDPSASAIAATIVDADLDGAPTITDVGEIVNRAIVVGGYEQVLDKSGNTQTTTTTVTNTTAKNQSFVPTEDYLGSVLVYTELVSGSESSISISVQGDISGAPDGVNLSNSHNVLKLDSIVDGGYTEFRFKSHVTLTPAKTHWIVLEGTTADGMKVGVDGGAVLDYKTRYPSRVSVMTHDDASQAKYGMYMQVFRDNTIEDPQVAEVMANEMLMSEPKKVANVVLRDDTLRAGDVVRLTLTTVGVAIDTVMKIVSSTQTLGEIFIYNELEMEEI